MNRLSSFSFIGDIRKTVPQNSTSVPETSLKKFFLKFGNREISIIISKIIVIITIDSCRKEVTKTGGSTIIKDVVIIRGGVRDNEN